MANRRDRGVSWGAIAASFGAAALGQALLWTPGLPSAGPRRMLGWALMALAAWALARAWRRMGEPAAAALPAWPRWGDLGALAMVLALALFLRTVKLDSYPNAGFRDEGETGNVSIEVLTGAKVSNTGTKLPVYIEEIYQNPAGYFYVSALSLKLFGVNMKSVRLTGVFWGVISVAFFYFLARALLGQPLALLAALSLAGLRWHMNFSRVGLIGIHALAASLPVMYFLWRGVNAPDPAAEQKRRKGRELWLLGGLGLAFASYTVPFSTWGGQDSPLSWLGWALRLALHAPLGLSLWWSRRDERSLSFGLMGAALGFCLYSYLASRLVVISVLLIWAAFFLRSQGHFAGAAGRRLALSVAGLIVGTLVTARGSFLEGGSALLKWLGLGLLASGLLGCAWALLSSLRSPGAYRAWIRPLLLGVAACWIVAAPLNNYMLRHRHQMFSRAQRVWVWGNEDYDARGWGAKLLQSVSRTVGMINVEGDGNPRHNDPGRPMFDPLLALLFGLGAFLALLRLGRPLPLFLMLWLQSHWLASYLGIEAPQGFRGIGAIAPCLLLAFYPLLPLAQALRSSLGRSWRSWALALLAPFVALALAWESYDYFVRQPKHPGVWSEFSAGEYEMGRRLKLLQPEHGGRRHTIGLFRPDWSDSWTVKFMAYPERRYEPFDVVKHVPMDPALALPGMDYYYVLDEAYLPLKQLLQGYYPNGKAEEYRHPITNELVFWSFLAPAEDIATAKPGGSGLRARYYTSRDDGKHWQDKDLAFKRVDPFILFNWTVAPVSGHFSVRWTGRLKVLKSGTHGFHVFSNNIAQMRVDGREILARDASAPGDRWTDARVSLEAGWHDIEVRYAETRNYSRMELWWTQPGSAEKTVVPGDLMRPE